MERQKERRLSSNVIHATPEASISTKDVNNRPETVKTGQNRTNDRERLQHLDARVDTPATFILGNK
jgi:hypothetical protein